MTTIVHFQESIQTAIPQIVDLLRHNQSYVRQSDAVVLEKLSTEGTICQIPTVNIYDILFLVYHCLSILASPIQYLFPVLLEDPHIHISCTEIFAHLIIHGQSLSLPMCHMMPLHVYL